VTRKKSDKKRAGAANGSPPVANDGTSAEPAEEEMVSEEGIAEGEPSVDEPGEGADSGPVSGEGDRLAAHGVASGLATDGEGEIEPARALSDAHLRGLLEALVFAADKPMKTGELARLASAPVRQVRLVLVELQADYAGGGILLEEVAGGWLFRTSTQYAPFVRELAGGRPVKLTRAQIETLAIAAYRQPITRPEIDEIRGVDSGATLKLLLERDLVRILGKKDEPGRPLLYGTTTHFLEFFNMKSLKDLPTLREFTELSNESRRVAEAELGEVLPDAVPTASDPREPPPPAEEEEESSP
jgi:segregation and condensation protein B